MTYVLALYRNDQIEGWLGFSSKIVARKHYATVISDREKAQSLANELNERFATFQDDRIVKVVPRSSAEFVEAPKQLPDEQFDRDKT